jgi:hypothetical protein
MRRYAGGYFSATRHPWPCLIFLLPLLAAYEAGVVWLGGTHPEALRNGADVWLRWWLNSFGFTQLYVAPFFIIVMLLIWTFLRQFDRPDHVVRVGFGMAFESLLLAYAFWALSRHLRPFLDTFGVHLNLRPPSPALGRIVTFVGAGIYEEALFRLLFFFGCGTVLRLLGVSFLFRAPLICLTSAILFSAAHHFGPAGERLDPYVFLFRTVAGLYFAILYLLRGFGIAVGAHACYDVLVGVLIF